MSFRSGIFRKIDPLIALMVSLSSASISFASAHPTCESAFGSPRINQNSELIISRKELNGWAESVLQNPAASPADRKRARFILGKFHEQELDEALKRIPKPEEREFIRSALKNPNTPGDRLNSILNVLEIFTAEQTDFLNFALGKDEPDTALDEVFEFSMRGMLTPDYNKDQSAQELARKIKAAQLAKISQNRDVIASSTVEMPLETLYRNIYDQLQKSKLFFGFGEPSIAVNIHVLRLKPIDQWPPEAQQLVNLSYGITQPGMGYFSPTNSLSDAWVYIFIKDFDIRRWGNQLTMNIQFDRLSALKTTAPSLTEWPISPRRFESVAQAGIKGETELYLNNFRPDLSMNLRNAQNVMTSSTGLSLPLSIVDWDRSVFQFHVSREKPRRGLGLGFHHVFFMATKLGREIVMTGGSSGSLQKASIASDISMNLPQHWDRVPAQFRRVPVDLNELSAFISWLNEMRFPSWTNQNGLSGPERNRLLGQ